MSPTDTRRFTNSAAATHPAEPTNPAPPDDGHVWVQGDDGSEGPRATGPRPSRSLTSVAVRNFRPRPFDDPATTWAQQGPRHQRRALGGWCLSFSMISRHNM